MQPPPDEAALEAVLYLQNQTCSIHKYYSDIVQMFVTKAYNPVADPGFPVGGVWTR